MSRFISGLAFCASTLMMFAGCNASAPPEPGEVLPIAASEPPNKESGNPVIFMKLLTERNLKESKEAAQQKLGLVSAVSKTDSGGGPGAEDLTLGKPLPYIWMRLDDLRKPEAPGAEAVGVLGQAAKKAIYPVMEADTIHFSIETQERKTKDRDLWKVTAFGKSATSKLLFDSRKKHAEQTKTPLDAYFVFSVPALNMDFLGLAPADGKAVLIPVLDDKAHGFRAGRAEPADQVLRRLHDFAVKVNTNAPG